ncbi:MAG TPA: hypothetical protein VF487_13615 [Chitinophagaceae bacterium]
MDNLTNNEHEEIINHIKQLLQVWHRLANSLLTTFVILGVGAIGTSLFITTFASKDNVLTIKICSFITTLLLTILTSFNLSKKGNGVRNGWRHLNAAYLKYQAKQISIGDLIKAYEEGEVMLGGVEFNYDTTQLKGTISRQGSKR